MRRPVTTGDVRRWALAYDRRETIRSIAIRENRCPKTVAAHLAAKGRKPGGRSLAARIRKMAAAGGETWAIAEALGVSRNHVSAVRSLAKKKEKHHE